MSIEGQISNPKWATETWLTDKQDDVITVVRDDMEQALAAADIDDHGFVAGEWEDEGFVLGLFRNFSFHGNSGTQHVHPILTNSGE